MQPLFLSQAGTKKEGLDLLLLKSLAGVTRIELASAVLETVALPLCYTPRLEDYKPRAI